MKKYCVDDLFDYKLDGTETVLNSGMGKSLVQWEDDEGDYYLVSEVNTAIKEAIEKIKNLDIRLSYVNNEPYFCKQHVISILRNI